MVIAAYISDKRSSLVTLLLTLAAEYPDDRFIFLHEDDLVNLPPNCSGIKTPSLKKKFAFYAWEKLTLATELKKQHAQGFISDRLFAGSLSGIKLFFYADDAARVVKLTAKEVPALNRTSKVFVSETYFADKISALGVSENIIQVLHHGLPDMPLQGEGVPDLLKQKFSDGFDYFFYSVCEDSRTYLIDLLKAFSLFKKMQKSAIKLILFSETSTSAEELIPGFKSYKYRDDVHVATSGEKNARNLVYHAYAVIWFCGYGPVNDSLSAMKNKVPVIALNNEMNRRIFGEAVVYSSAVSAELSEKMQDLYRDEAMRARLIHSAGMFTEKYNAARAAKRLREVIAADETDQ